MLVRFDGLGSGEDARSMSYALLRLAKQFLAAG